jgi:hypothetical protein
MGDMAAVRAAIDILLIPSRVEQAREAALPGGMSVLLEVAAGNGEAVRRAAERTGRPAELVRQAAVFFIEQVLLSQSSDSYRVLGATAMVTAGELRRNMALLQKWLHPDVQRERERSIFASRVALAWDDLKTPERRTAYDEMQSAFSRERRGLRREQKKRRRLRAKSRAPGNGWEVLSNREGK